MARGPTTPRLVTPRDLEILAALNHCPLTVRQLLKLSQVFTRPFTDEKCVRERMQVLCDAGRVRRWHYATAGRGAQNYYTLSPLGYRLLCGQDAPLPTKRYFDPVSLAHQYHTQSLADFIVHTMVCAQRSGVEIQDFYRENALRLEIADQCLYPDSTFLLRSAEGNEFGFLVEIDNGRERVHSTKDVDSWQRKIRLYETLQDLCPRRFRVLIVTNGSADRLHHILATAAELATNPHRHLFYGIRLSDYLQEQYALSIPVFLDHHGQLVALLQHRKTATVQSFEREPLPLGTPTVLGRSPRQVAVC